MKSESFCYWLQGYFELQGTTQALTINQVDCIKRHLNMVFKHEIDPAMGDQKHQGELNELHNKQNQKIHAGDLYPTGGGGTFCPSTTLIRC